MAISPPASGLGSSNHPHQPLPQASFRTSKPFFRTFSLVHSRKEHKPISASPAAQQCEEKARLANPFPKDFMKSRSNSDKRSKESALTLRSLIVGSLETGSQLKITHAKPRLGKVKAQLVKPKTANKVIAHLRDLPISDAVEGKEDDRVSRSSAITGPIRAVCLEHTDAEQHRLYFASLTQHSQNKLSDISSVPIDKLSAIFHEINIIDLMQPPDFGLGQPGTGKGILAGALPTPETVLDGLVQITPQLMNLGYATGKAIYPNHKG